MQLDAGEGQAFYNHNIFPTHRIGGSPGPWLWTLALLPSIQTRRPTFFIALPEHRNRSRPSPGNMRKSIVEMVTQAEAERRLSDLSRGEVRRDREIEAR
jgi:hypothetical protein